MQRYPSDLGPLILIAGSSKRIAPLISGTWFARVSPSNLGSETLKKIEP